MLLMSAVGLYAQTADNLDPQDVHAAISQNHDQNHVENIGDHIHRIHNVLLLIRIEQGRIGNTAHILGEFADGDTHYQGGSVFPRKGGDVGHGMETHRQHRHESPR